MVDLFTYAEEQSGDVSPSKEKAVLTVTQLSNQLRMLVEGQFHAVAVEGEISSLKKAASGHIYFDLKDNENIVKSIVWRSSAERFATPIEEGQQVVVYGKLTTYGARSNYQLIVNRVEPAGLGALMQRFEELKKRLEAEGLFSTERKKALPFIPQKIGIITSEGGAVIEDMLHRIRDRFPRHILFYPVLVQGVGAKEQIAQAVHYFNQLEKTQQPDVLIVARGGGSLEDLWAFNEEMVVRAIAESHIPVISAVGHEPDVTLCDYVADLRAPTPSAAAEMVVPVQSELVYTVSIFNGKLTQAMRHKLLMEQKQLRLLKQALGDPTSLLNQAKLRLDERSERFYSVFKGFTKLKRQGLFAVAGRLNPALLQKQWRILNEKLQEKEKLLISFSPEGPLKRGYVYLTDSEDKVIRTKQNLQESNIQIHFVDGTVQAQVKDVVQ